ncbi:hypothetical protein F5Y19DRAFT_429968 [Xylariaceae sp. FL1651]|nr:hypothetical protein F5Y19DRAFT_429968 [Xylariaceae sp. FL1651]
MIPTIVSVISLLLINISGKTDHRHLHALASSFSASHLAELRNGTRLDNRAPID